MSSIQLTVASVIGRALPPIIAQRARLIIYPMKKAYTDKLDFKGHALTGSLLHGNTNDYYYWHFCIHGYFDWRNIAIAKALCNEGDLLIEVGANVGTETINFSDIVGRTGEVIAFEPIPNNIVQMKKALSHTRFQNVTLHQLAVLDQDTKVHFVLTAQSGTGHIKFNSTADVETLEVECVKLDSIIPLSNRVSGIFVDAEGVDVQILRGAREIIQRWQPFIVVEMNNKHMKRAGLDINDLVNALPNYEFYRITRLGLSAIQKPLEEYTDANWLCLPDSKNMMINRISAKIRRTGLLPFGLGIR